MELNWRHSLRLSRPRASWISVSWCPNVFRPYSWCFRCCKLGVRLVVVKTKDWQTLSKLRIPTLRRPKVSSVPPVMHVPLVVPNAITSPHWSWRFLLLSDCIVVDHENRRSFAVSPGLLRCLRQFMIFLNSSFRHSFVNRRSFLDKFIHWAAFYATADTYYQFDEILVLMSI